MPARRKVQMVKYFFIVVFGVVAAVMIYAATKPDHFRIERSIVIQAPPEKIFPYINDYKKWTAWSPYEKKDPAMTRTYSEPSAGKGATYSWEGNHDIGSGRMEMLESIPTSKVLIDLQFIKP